ncbi:MAG: radical SAM protein [Solobacterium sp.]|nr:radical SAM protein [Solobacterium sp.]
MIDLNTSCKAMPAVQLRHECMEQAERAMKQKTENIRRYLLDSRFALRGWKLLPFAVQHRDRPLTEFFRKDKYRLLLDCDGETEIDFDTLTDEERFYYDQWEKNGIIRRSAPGEKLLPFQQYRYYDARFKQKVQWSVTGKCNYRCRHCFMSAPHAAQGEPSWQELMTMLDAFERCGIRTMHLTGGEPLVRRDFFDLVDEILKRDLCIETIYSNGLLVTDSFLDQLEERGIRPSIQFSFDGIGHHDWMRGIKGAEKIALDAIRRCISRGFQVTVSMVVCRESLGSIRDTVNLLASLGVSHLKVGAASPQGEWVNEPEHFLTMPEMFEGFLEYIPHYFEDGKPMSIGLGGVFSYDVFRQRAFSLYEKDIEESLFPNAQMCSHVRREMYVSPQGRVLPCMSMVGGPIEQQFPNLLETPLEKILDQNSLYMDIVSFTVEDYMKHNADCQTCDYRQNCCGGCRATAVRDHENDYLSKDLEVCEYFRGGWKEKKDHLLEQFCSEKERAGSHRNGTSGNR